MLERITTILFDLDGTLVNSAPDLAAALNATMSEMGRNEYPLETVTTWIGNGANKLLKRALSGEIDGEPESHLLEQALPVFMKHYEQNLVSKTYVYDGVHEALSVLRSAGVQMACVTNKPIGFVAPILRKFKLDEFIYVTVGAGSLPQLKPAADPLLLACEKLNVETSLIAETVLMVGDSSSDIKAAKAANMQSVAVDYGYAQGVNLLELGATTEISNILDLPKLMGL